MNEAKPLMILFSILGNLVLILGTYMIMIKPDNIIVNHYYYGVVIGFCSCAYYSLTIFIYITEKNLKRIKNEKTKEMI